MFDSGAHLGHSGPTALAIFLFLAVAATASGQSLLVVTEDWAPYNYQEDGVAKGFSVEVVQTIARELKVSVDLRFYPSMRAKSVFENTPGAVMITMLRTPERETKYQWVGPLGDSAVYFYKRKGSPLVINTLEDAKKVRSVACRQAGLVYSQLKAEGFTNLDSTAVSGLSVYELLIRGRCDLAVSDTPLGVVYLMKQRGYPVDAVVQTPVAIVEFPAYMAFSPSVPRQEVGRWQGALDRMKASGAFGAILRRYQE